jgi:hypothetical protein
MPLTWWSDPNLSLRLIDVTKPDGTENMLARYEVKTE